jgi:CheY-like chemotaxis protein
LATRKSAAPAPAGHTALLVEDDPEMAEELLDLLRSLGHRAVHVPSQQEACHLISTHDDLCYVLLDLQILAQPGSIKPLVEAGLGVLQHLRQECPQRNGQGEHRLPALVMSGHAKDAPWVVRAMRLGADDFVVKPLSENREPLGDKIRRVLTASGRDDHRDCSSLTHQSRARARPNLPPPPSPRPGGYCRAIENGRPERWVDEAEYAALVASAPECHLYLNLLHSSRQRSYTGGLRDRKGHFRTFPVPAAQGAVLAAVMRAPQGLRGSQLKLHTHRPAPTFREARRRLDLQLPSGEWRAFKTLPADVADHATFILQPAPEVRYLLLHNLGETGP